MRENVREAAVFIGGAFALMVVIGAIGGKPAPTPQVKPTPSPTPSSTASGAPDWYVISRAKQDIEAKLRDPESADFSDVYVSRRGGTRVVCGMINSRNGFGGMTGKQRFLSNGVVSAVEEQVEGGIDELWTTLC